MQETFQGAVKSTPEHRPLLQEKRLHLHAGSHSHCLKVTPQGVNSLALPGLNKGANDRVGSNENSKWEAEKCQLRDQELLEGKLLSGDT